MIQTAYKTYQAAADTDVVIASGKAILHRVIFGADVASAVVEISDHASDGDGNIFLKISGSTLATSVGSLEIGAVFNNGITADIANQTDVTFIWEPIA